jgi:hypothetical protein
MQTPCMLAMHTYLGNLYESQKKQNQVTGVYNADTVHSVSEMNWIYKNNKDKY